MADMYPPEVQALMARAISPPISNMDRYGGGYPASADDLTAFNGSLNNDVNNTKDWITQNQDGSVTRYTYSPTYGLQKGEQFGSYQELLGKAQQGGPMEKLMPLLIGGLITGGMTGLFDGIGGAAVGNAGGMTAGEMAGATGFSDGATAGLSALTDGYGAGAMGAGAGTGSGSLSSLMNGLGDTTADIVAGEAASGTVGGSAAQLAAEQATRDAALTQSVNAGIEGAGSAAVGSVLGAGGAGSAGLSALGGGALSGLAGAGLGALGSGAAGAGLSSLIAPALGAGASLIGAGMNANAASNAAKTQADATNASIAELRRQYDLNRSDQMPWLTAGSNAVGRLSDLTGISGNTGADGYGSLMKRFSMADFNADPGYDFRLKEGQQALERSASAKGLIGSGNVLAALTKYGQDMGSQEYGNAYNRYNQDQTNQYNRLAGISGTGQTTASNLGTMGANNANSISNLVTNQGNANAASGIAGANAWTSGLTGLAGSVGSYFKNQQDQSNIDRYLSGRGY